MRQQVLGNLCELCDLSRVVDTSGTSVTRNSDFSPVTQRSVRVVALFTRLLGVRIVVVLSFDLPPWDMFAQHSKLGWGTRFQCRIFGRISGEYIVLHSKSFVTFAHQMGTTQVALVPITGLYSAEELPIDSA